MSFGEPTKEPAIDMKKFRRDLRRMWNLMRFQYQSGVQKWYDVPFPEMKYRESKRDRDDRDAGPAD